MIGIFRELYRVVRPSGRRRLAQVLALVGLQALVQTLAVFSLLPFLSAAADMARFRQSRLGEGFVAVLGPIDDQKLLTWIGLLALAVLVLGNVVALGAEYARARYANRVAHDLRVRLVSGLLARRYEWFLGQNGAILVKNLIEDVGMVAGQLITPALDIVARGLLVLLLVAVALMAEPWIVLGGVVVVALYYLALMRPLRRRAEASSETLKRGVRAMYFEVLQLLGGIKPIVAGGRERHFLARVERASRDFARAMPWVPMYSAIPRSTLEVVVFGGLIVWMLVALAGGTPLAALIPRVGLIAVVAYRLMPSIQALFSQAAAIAASRQALDEVVALGSDSALPPDEGVRPEPLHWTRDIRFEDVSFTYAGAETPAVDRVSFIIPKGRRVAFVGRTGSGKSTLIDLLLGLLQPTSGRILIDGAPLDAALLPRWRAAVGYVPQELFLLDGTIAENIDFGGAVGGPDRARAEAAADLAHAREFIDDGRSLGFDARVGERGAKLSGGQRQRLGLARAVYGEPNVLVLDEATSALDPETERAVVAALAAAHVQLTVITITHRMATVRDYDEVHYVEAGRIAASGDFATLAATHPAFQRFAH